MTDYPDIVVASDLTGPLVEDGRKDSRNSEKGLRVSIMNAGSDIEGKGK